MRAELSVRTIGEAGDRRGHAIRDLLDGEGWHISGLALGIGHDPLPPLTGSTSAHKNEDCKNDCGLDLQSHVKRDCG